MADASEQQGSRVVAWELRLIGWIPLPPFAAGAVVALAIGGVLLGARMVMGRPLCAESRLAPAEELTAGWIVAALIGYTMAAGRYLNAAILGDVIEGAGFRRDTIAAIDEQSIYGTDPGVIRRSRVTGALGAAVGLLILYATGAGFLRTDRILHDPEAMLWAVLVPLLCFLLSRACFNTALGVTGRQQGAPHLQPMDVDLIDLRPVYARGRIGLRLALVWIVGSTISSLFIFDPHLVTPILPFMLAGLGVAVAAFFLPSRRLHRAIREEKHRELARVRAELRRLRDGAAAGHDAEPGQLADLLAQLHYLDELREWPFDNPTMARFFLYLLIPVGSWLGGALVERVVSNLLD